MIDGSADKPKVSGVNVLLRLNSKLPPHECRAFPGTDDKLNPPAYAMALAAGAPAPRTWQYGSPLWDPVSSRHLCWDGHVMTYKSKNDCVDNGMDGVSCDFCGYVYWFSDSKEATKRAGHSESTAEERLGHCDECEIDICHMCLADVKRDVRFHVPCLECRRCHVLFRTASDAAHPHHQCSGGAPSVVAAAHGVALSPSRKRPVREEADADVVVMAAKPVAPETGRTVGSGPSASHAPRVEWSASATPNRSHVWEAVVSVPNAEPLPQLRDFLEQNLSASPVLAEVPNSSSHVATLGSVTRTGAERIAQDARDLGFNAIVRART